MTSRPRYGGRGMSQCDCRWREKARERREGEKGRGWEGAEQSVKQLLSSPLSGFFVHAICIAGADSNS